jgi:hypothetical protein
MKLKKVATWHNDGTPHGRWQWEPGHEPPALPLRYRIVYRLLAINTLLAYIVLFIALAKLVNP